MSGSDCEVFGLRLLSAVKSTAMMAVIARERRNLIKLLGIERIVRNFVNSLATDH